MIVLVLIVIGIVVFLMFGNGASSEPEKVRPHRQKDADKEFEDMYFNGASGDDIDDF